ncbi:uncharacterized protein ACFDR9_003609 [Janthinobacterium sp. CG_23.3]|uniref:C39 family peptidase n=1 Tax=Janthinobacterium sp. CG_23.3 TaxID=3349634 RepID=UPI0038D3E3B1
MGTLSTTLLAAALLADGAAATAMEFGSLGGARFQVPVTSLKEARFHTTLRQQYDFSCGSAAVATLLSHHYAYPVSEQFVFEQMYLLGDQTKIKTEGFSLLDIKRFLAAHGFVADGFQLPLHKLLDAGFPAIVLLSDHGYHHFVVVKGLSESRVLVGDPAGGTRAMARDSFEAMWRSKLLFVIHGVPARAGPARFNAAADWRVAPTAPLATAVNRNGLDTVTIPRHGQGEF